MNDATFLAKVQLELASARSKFPNPECSLAALVEEVGELATALLEEDTERICAEAVQVACVAARIALEGDPSMNAFRARNGVPQHPEDE